MKATAIVTGAGQTHGLRYLHLRPVDEEGKVYARGGATLAYAEDRDQDGGIVTRYAVAYCHPYDNYNKATGRFKASKQMERMTFVGATNEVTAHGFLRFATDAGDSRTTLPELLAVIEAQSGYVRVL